MYDPGRTQGTARTILVGVDDSDSSLSAARAAAVLAADSGATLHVVTAYRGDSLDDVDVGVEGDMWTIGSEQAGLDLVRRVAHQLDLPVEQVVTRAVHGRPAQVLIAEAERLGVDVIVVGNRRVQGIARVLGSVAGAVVHQAPCDVYVVKST